jgi:hypothetical protein
LGGNKVKEILDIVEEIERVLEQVKKETKGNKDLEEREECFSEEKTKPRVIKVAY